MRSLITAAFLTLASVTAVPASAAVSVSIGFNVPAYPRLVAIPGYPVYYAPGLNANYFFYDGMYWYFDGVNWYDSPWYNGPWTMVDPFYVPTYVLRVPVRYYHRPPAWFHRSWRADYAPHWHEHWGANWSSRRGDWQHGNAGSARLAPLPSYQSRYSGNNYPTATHQQAQIHSQQYSYTPREQIVRQHYLDHAGQQLQQRQESRAAQQEQRHVQQEQRHAPQEQRHMQQEQRHEQQREAREERQQR